MIVGIDPGNSGAIAWLYHNGDLAGVEDMPVVDKIVSAPLLTDLLEVWADQTTLVIVEAVHSMPKQGVASSFKFGQSYGTALGVVGGLRLRSQLVTPQSWKKAMGLTSDKERSRRMAIERWPAWSDSFKLKKHDGRAEAALLAEYARTITPWEDA